WKRVLLLKHADAFKAWRQHAPDRRGDPGVLLPCLDGNAQEIIVELEAHRITVPYVDALTFQLRLNLGCAWLRFHQIEICARLKQLKFGNVTEQLERLRAKHVGFIVAKLVVLRVVQSFHGGYLSWQTHRPGRKTTRQVTGDRFRRYQVSCSQST